MREDYFLPEDDAAEEGDAAEASSSSGAEEEEEGSDDHGYGPEGLSWEAIMASVQVQLFFLSLMQQRLAVAPDLHHQCCRAVRRAPSSPVSALGLGPYEEGGTGLDH